MHFLPSRSELERETQKLCILALQTKKYNIYIYVYIYREDDVYFQMTN